MYEEHGVKSPVEVQKASQVADHFGRLEERIEAVAKSVLALTDALKPVSREQIPATQPDKPKLPESLVPVAYRLSKITEAVQLVINVVQDARRRLEL